MVRWRVNRRVEKTPMRFRRMGLVVLVRRLGEIKIIHKTDV
jgi:hypothetical protein